MKSVFRKKGSAKKHFLFYKLEKKSNSVIRVSLDIFTIQCLQITHLVKFCLFFIMLLHFFVQLNSLVGKYGAVLPDICFSNFLKITFPAQFPPVCSEVLNSNFVRQIISSLFVMLNLSKFYMDMRFS